MVPFSLFQRWRHSHSFYEECSLRTGMKPSYDPDQCHQNEDVLEQNILDPMLLIALRAESSLRTLVEAIAWDGISTKSRGTVRFPKQASFKLTYSY